MVTTGSVAAFNSAVGLVWRRAALSALTIQACMAIAVTAAAVTWTASIVIMGTPKDIGFAWSPGFLGLIAGYSVYLLRRTILRRCVDRPSIYYSHLWAFVAVLPLEGAVVFRMVFDFMTRH